MLNSKVGVAGETFGLLTLMPTGGIVKCERCLSMEEEIKEQPVEQPPDDGDHSSGRSYERSKIAFPYGDLDDALEVVKPIYNRGGHTASFHQLVDWMGHKDVNSGTFRVKVATARTFGLVLVDRDNVTLTQLGRDINDPHSEIAARAKSFLQVPLYRKIFDTYKGGPLPKDANLETTIESFGVAPKQTKRARQTFQRSAGQAGVFNERQDRLVLPPGVSLDSKPSEEMKSRKMDSGTHAAHIAPTDSANPALLALFDLVPPTGSEWSREERRQWIEFAERLFNRLYKDKERDA